MRVHYFRAGLWHWYEISLWHWHWIYVVVRHWQCPFKSHSLHPFLSFIFPIFPVSFYLLYFPNHSLFHSLYHSLYHFRYFYLSLHLFLSFIFPVFPCIIIFHSSSKSFSLSFPVTFSLFNDPYLSLFHYFTFLHSFFSLFPYLRETGPSTASF